MTEKLFYQDSHLAEFEAEVLSCEPVTPDILPGHSGGFAAELDRTAFFPEGGGREFRYLWSGDYTPWRSQGAADYWERGRKAHVFHFFREGGKLRGWGWERRD